MNAYQQKKVSQGLCGVCGKRPLATSLRCKECQEQRLAAQRKSRMRLLIDNDIKNALRQLNTEEKDALHDSLDREGCRDKLVAWKQLKGPAVLVDGHHRKEYCDKKGIKYQVEEREFPSKDAALAWLKLNQAGRRNLTANEIAYLRGKQYNEAKQTRGRPPENLPEQSSDNSVTVTELSEDKEGGNKKHQSTSSDKPATVAGLSEDKKSGETADRLAAEYDVSPRTIHNDAAFAEAVDELKVTDPPAAEAALKGEATKKETVKKAGKKPSANGRPAKPPKSGSVTFDDKKIKDAFGVLVRLLGERKKARGDHPEREKCLDRLDEALSCFKRWQEAGK